MALSNKKSFKKFTTRKDATTIRIDNPGIDDVYMLRWTSNNQLGNLAKWKEHIEAHAAHHYKELSKMFRLNNYYVPPPVEIPTDDNGDVITADNDPGGYIADEYRAKVRIRLQLIATMESNRYPLFTAMKKRLSVTSEQILMCDESWLEIEESQDPLALWLLIQQTHLGGNGGVGTKVIPGETLRVLNQQLEKTKMGETEHLANYLRRFQSAIEAYAGADIDAPEDSLQVAIFLENPDDYRFRALKSRIKNDFHQADVDYPDTVIAAFRRANDWEIDNPVKFRGKNGSTPTFTSTSFQTKENSRGSSSIANATALHAKSESNNKKKGKKNFQKKEKKEIICHLCSEPGHILRDCPHLEECQSMCKKDSAKEAGSHHVSAEAMTLHVDIDEELYEAETRNHEIIHDDEFDENCSGERDILLDNQSQIHIFKNKALRHGIHKARECMKISGQVEEASFTTSEAGYFLDMDAKVFTSEKAKANLLSYAIVSNQYEIEWNQAQKSFYVRISEETTLRFQERDRLYICNVDKDIVKSTEIASYLANSSYQVNCTPREVKQAEVARVLIQRLGFPSNQVVNLLQNGSILKAPVNSSDIYRAEKLFGPPIPSIKGKTVKQKTKLPKDLEFFEPRVERIQVMHSDIMFVNDQSFLISVLRPLDLTLTTKVKALKKRWLKKALESQWYLINSRDLKISHAYTDGGLACLNDAFGEK